MTAATKSSAADISYERTFRRLVRGTTINDATLLSTDYMNHFNEIAMIFDLIADMPECLEDAREWQPRTYQEHFRQSVFSHKDLAIAAYDHAPRRFLKALERTVDHLEREIAAGVAEFEILAAADQTDQLRLTTVDRADTVRNLIARASAIINGHEDAVEAAQQAALDTPVDGGPVDAAHVDDPLAPSDDEAGEEVVTEIETLSQDEIDSLFD